jgi:hypothetical protein
VKAFDSVLVWVIILALVAVVVGSGQTDPLIKSVTKVLTTLISVITAPQGQGK